MSGAVDGERLMRFLLEMRQAGVTDPKALLALERTPRDHYAPVHLAQLAYDDSALPLADGQTMTKPSIIGRVLSALELHAGANVLEIGTGSGYQAAAIGALARRVTTLDRFRVLVTDARARLGLARLMHVEAHLGDGAAGWIEAAPYDRIVLNSAVTDIPPVLLAQLAPGGALIAPIVGPAGQRLIRSRGGQREDLGPIKFAPMMSGSEV